jgi:hypothetical protein
LKNLLEINNNKQKNYFKKKTNKPHTPEPQTSPYNISMTVENKQMSMINSSKKPWSRQDGRLSKRQTYLRFNPWVCNSVINKEFYACEQFFLVTVSSSFSEFK